MEKSEKEKFYSTLNKLFGVAKWIIIIIIAIFVISFIVTLITSEPYEPPTEEEMLSIYHDNAENWTKANLEEDGYEILSTYYSPIWVDSPIGNALTNDTTCYPDRTGDSLVSNTSCLTKYTSASVEMTSLGNRREQITSALISMSVQYDYNGNPDVYRIDIIEPTQECSYIFRGSFVNNYFKFDGSVSYEDLTNEIQRVEYCE